jgi:hypothetical protein
MSVSSVAVTIVLLVLALVLWRRQLSVRREAFIREFPLPQGLFTKLMARHPQLSLKDCQLVARGLRQFFLAYLKSGRKFVSMPSQVVDDLWHELILYTRYYHGFCKKAFGGFFHHSPAAVLGSAKQSNEGLRRCWWHSCKDENINPRTPTRLPLLFALDAKLNIADGFYYAADCQALRRRGREDAQSTIVYCGGDFASTSFDGSTDGFGDGGGASGSGCGGSSCGGGGCSGGGGD